MSLATHRPRGIAEIVDATFVLYRAHAAAIATVAVVVTAPPAIIKTVAPAAFAGIIALVGGLLLPIGQGAITAIIAAAVERNEALDVGEAFRRTAGRRGSLIAVQITAGLMVFIGCIFLLVPGFIALAWTAVTVPVVMIEQLGYSNAIDRSRVLARRRWRHIFGTLLLSWGIVLLLMIGASVIVGLFGATTGIGDFLLDILFAFALPVPAIAVTLLYYDLRVRSESADLDAMISALPAPTPAA
jgi:hypothetical protein